MLNTVRAFLVITLLFTKSITAQTSPLRVAVASSLLPAFEEIKIAFEISHSYKIELIAGASGTLAHQILNGAPYHVYISADAIYSDLLYRKGLLSNAPIPLFRGQLAVWSAQKLASWDQQNQDRSIKELLARAKTIAIAHPTTAPYGAASLALLKSLHVFDTTKSKVIYANNISLINQLIVTQSIDLAFTARASAIYLEGKSIGYWYNIDGLPKNSLGHYYSPVNSSSNNNQTSEFLQFIQSSSNEATFLKYNYQITH